jgi:1,4-alpha-glucan branching enzyme
MGTEIAQRREWNHEAALDWSLLEESGHAGMLAWVTDLNRLIRSEPALYRDDHDPAGFRWVDADDSARSLLSFLRFAGDAEPILVVINFAPVAWPNVVLGVPEEGSWHLALTSDDPDYGGSGSGKAATVWQTEKRPVHGMDQSITMTVPPLAALFVKPGSDMA